MSRISTAKPVSVPSPSSRGLSADAALSLIRAARPSADPNEGFRAQLDLFGDMRCSLDAQHPVYRMWCLEEVGEQSTSNARWW